MKFSHRIKRNTNKKWIQFISILVKLNNFCQLSSKSSTFEFIKSSNRPIIDYFGIEPKEHIKNVSLITYAIFLLWDLMEPGNFEFWMINWILEANNLLIEQMIHCLSAQIYWAKNELLSKNWLDILTLRAWPNQR